MDDKERELLLLRSMNSFHNMIKIVVSERHNTRILTERQFFAVKKIAEFDKIELKNLSRELYVSTSSLCILLNKLVEQGYVYREEDPKDRRNTFYGLTEEGRVVLKKEREDILRVLSEKLSKVDSEKKDEFFEHLEKVYAFMPLIMK